MAMCVYNNMCELCVSDVLCVCVCVCVCALCHMCEWSLLALTGGEGEGREEIGRHYDGEQ